MYHNFFIHPSVDGHLHCFSVLAIVNSAAMENGIHVFQHLHCFSVLAIVNSAAMENGIHVFFQFWSPQGICLGVELVGHMVVLFLVF